MYSEADGQYSYTKSAAAADNSLRILPEEWQTLGIRPSKLTVIVPNMRRPR
ncbi:Gp19/Gp15/Gp42 family protein [Mycolicibacterium neoaurum]|uniref:Gp19/Gp15/Gp42 family protein n=1 Tax=Mycolicibacterium neoaurum TaxID=1795 RepID=UPI001F4C8D6A|nr:Gp19/Gp15/Gp42 family protein [Mycolicibacterium neoaurum]